MLVAYHNRCVYLPQLTSKVDDFLLADGFLHALSQASLALCLPLGMQCSLHTGRERESIEKAQWAFNDLTQKWHTPVSLPTHW